jgi:hypothetical protein
MESNKNSVYFNKMEIRSPTLIHIKPFDDPKISIICEENEIPLKNLHTSNILDS